MNQIIKRLAKEWETPNSLTFGLEHLCTDLANVLVTPLVHGLDVVLQDDLLSKGFLAVETLEA